MAEGTCSVEDCDRPRRDRLLLCSLHYYRKWKHGSLAEPAKKNGTCSRCPEPIDLARNRARLCQRCKRRQWYVDHRDHERATNDRWRQQNADHDRARRLAFYRANLDRLREQTRIYYWRNRETVLQREAERRRRDPGRHARWRAKNPERWALRNRENQRRRHRRPGEPPVDFGRILAEHGMTCHICGGAIASLSDLHFDHVVPLSRGGQHVAENIRPSHALCNMRKGARIA